MHLDADKCLPAPIQCYKRESTCEHDENVELHLCLGRVLSAPVDVRGESRSFRFAV